VVTHSFCNSFFRCSCLILAAVAVGVVSAVTLETSLPTSAANYMVLPGEFEYVVGGVNFGAVSGRAQLVRSALEAESLFSLSIKIENFVSSCCCVGVHGCVFAVSTHSRVCYRSCSDIGRVRLLAHPFLDIPLEVGNDCVCAWRFETFFTS
jgi:hypothetical protein